MSAGLPPLCHTNLVEFASDTLMASVDGVYMALVTIRAIEAATPMVFVAVSIVVDRLGP